jgi:branched-chain amino acid transport system substrate-binding protein
MRLPKLLVAVAGLAWLVAAGDATAQGPIRIGFLSPLSGAIALRAVKVGDAPRGPVEMDAYGNPTQTIYIRKVERVGGKLQNTVIHTYPHVSQFWTYTPEEFLKQPVYSRDLPPCKHC